MEPSPQGCTACGRTDNNTRSVTTLDRTAIILMTVKYSINGGYCCHAS
jgi:hypothetical protein